MHQRCCTIGLADAFKCNSAHSLALLWQRCDSCSIKSEWHNSRHLCNVQCCWSLQSDCLQAFLKIIPPTIDHIPADVVDAIKNAITGLPSTTTAAVEGIDAVADGLSKLDIVDLEKDNLCTIH